MPARIMSWWLTISASVGASFRVPIKKRDAFIQKFSKAGARRLNGFSTQTCGTCRTCGTSERRDSDAVRRSAARPGTQAKRTPIRVLAGLQGAIYVYNQRNVKGFDGVGMMHGQCF